MVAVFGGLWLLRGVVGLRWVVFPPSALGLALFTAVGLNLFLLIELLLYLQPRPLRSLPFEEAVLQRVEEMYRREDYAAIVPPLCEKRQTSPASGASVCRMVR